MDTLTICGFAGTFAGSFVAAVIAGKASKRSKSAEESSKSAEASAVVVKQEILGPGDEPSVRKMIQDTGKVLADHREEVSKSSAVLHADVGELSKRIVGLENAVFTNMEKRLGKVEDAVYDALRRATRPLIVGSDRPRKHSQQRRGSTKDKS